MVERMAKTNHPGIYSRETKDGKTVYDLRFRDAEGKQTTDRGYRTITLAKKALEGHKATVKAGKYVAPAAGRATVGELWTELQTVWTHLAPQTLATRKSTYRTWIEDRWSSVQVKKVSTKALREWIQELQEEPTSASPSTLSNIRKVLLPLFDLAIEGGKLVKNPITPLPSFQEVHSQRVYLSHSQVEALLEEAKSDPVWKLILSILAFNGLRIGELVGLRVKSVNLARKRITVSQSVDLLEGEIVKGSTKSKKLRDVPIFDIYSDLLSEQVKGKNADDWLFPGTDPSRPANADALRRRLARTVERIRKAQTENQVDPSQLFPEITPHELRHTAASLAVASGATVLAVQRMLGHATPAITLNVYADLFDSDLDALADAVSAAHKAAADNKMTTFKNNIDLPQSTPSDTNEQFSGS